MKTVKDVVTAAGVLGKGCDSAVGKLLYHLATNAGGKTTDANLALIGRAIGEGKIDKVRIIAATKLAVAAGQRGECVRRRSVSVTRGGAFLTTVRVCVRAMYVCVCMRCARAVSLFLVRACVACVCA